LPHEDATSPIGSYRFECDAEHKIFAVRFEAWLDDDVLKAFYQAAPAFLKSREVRAAVVDFSSLSGLKISTDAIHEIAQQPPAFPDTIPRFVVAPSELTFGLARMFEMMSEKKTKGLLVVRTLAEVHAALGVQKPAFHQLL